MKIRAKKEILRRRLKNVKENERFRLMKPDQPPWIH